MGRNVYFTYTVRRSYLHASRPTYIVRKKRWSATHVHIYVHIYVYIHCILKFTRKLIYPLNPESEILKYQRTIVNDICVKIKAQIFAHVAVIGVTVCVCPSLSVYVCMISFLFSFSPKTVFTETRFEF